MKFLLVAINAKYIHSNPGIYSLKSYTQQKLTHQGVPLMSQIEIGEYTINHQRKEVLKQIYRMTPDFVGISCYIWNMDFVLNLMKDLKKVLPDLLIWLGGPEVSYDASEFLRQHPEATGIMRGEGEEIFYQLVSAYTGAGQLTGVPGITYRNELGSIVENPPPPLLDLDEIPFAYGDLKQFEHRIVYYESSRGCPFSCSYCLSSIDKSVRFRSWRLVKEELDFFISNRVPQVKFIDRTFNCKKEHTLAIWRYLSEHDNGVTNFHFEVSADLLGEEELEVIKTMRPGLIQLEIGIQSTNQDTIAEISRSMKLEKLYQVVQRVKLFGNTHQHLDLIAGLPFEDFASFQTSFDQVYRLNPDQLQLGFLKVLKGSHMERKAAEYHLLYESKPPYEVLSTRWISFAEILALKSVEEMVEVYYNSGQFTCTIAALNREFDSPFGLYLDLAEYYEDKGLLEVKHNRLRRYEILYQWITEKPFDIDYYADLITKDLYLRENLKSRPEFALDQSPFKAEIKEFFIREAERPEYLTDYFGYDSRQLSKMTHVEVFRDGSRILFDYRQRDPLTYNARAVTLKYV